MTDASPFVTNPDELARISRESSACILATRHARAVRALSAAGLPCCAVLAGATLDGIESVLVTCRADARVQLVSLADAAPGSPRGYLAADTRTALDALGALWGAL